MKLLVVEDDQDLATGLVKALRAEAFIVSHAANGAEAKTLYSTFEPDIIILDLGLPDIDGTTLLKTLRQQGNKIPVLILTARDALDDKVHTLDLGADDYLAKPFDMPELLARLRVISRHLGTAGSSQIQVGSVVMDTSAHKVVVDQEVINLPRREYMTLKVLMENVGRVKTKEMIENSLYSWGDEIGSNAIEVHISNLRKKLPKNFITTVRGVGYTINHTDN